MATFDSVVVDVKKLTQQDIVKEAKRLNAEVMQTPPRPLGFTRHVDGREAPEEAVKPDGVIVYDYNRLDVVTKLALEVLKELSPVGSGKDKHPGLYRNSHRIVMETASEVRITNTVEYSRVIEVGKRGSVVLRIKGGGRVYDRAQRRLARMPDVGNSVKVKMAFTETNGTAVGEGRAARRAAQWPTLILTAM